MHSTQSIGIIGAGIGGLTLALLFEQRNIPWALYEKESTIESLGYGIQLSPNAVRVLIQLGLADELKSISHKVNNFALSDLETGKRLIEWEKKFSLPYYQCRRRDLHDLLYAKITNKNQIYLGHEFSSYKAGKNNCTLHFTNENIKAVSHSAVIGCDGVNSKLKRTWMPDTKAQYSGYLASRAIFPYTDEFNELIGTTKVFLAANKHVVIYLNSHPDNGEAWINCVFIKKSEKSLAETWNLAIDSGSIAADFSSQSNLLNKVYDALQSSDEKVYTWGLYQHHLMTTWTKDRACLLGDAAHPMLPFMAQGAAMAIEDAYALSNSLSYIDCIETAFKKYEQIRIKRCHKVQLQSFQNAKRFHVHGPVKFIRDTGLKTLNLFANNLLANDLNWIYDYDVTQENYQFVSD